MTTATANDEEADDDDDADEGGPAVSPATLPFAAASLPFLSLFILASLVAKLTSKLLLTNPVAGWCRIFITTHLLSFASSISPQPLAPEEDDIPILEGKTEDVVESQPAMGLVDEILDGKSYHHEAVRHLLHGIQISPSDSHRFTFLFNHVLYVKNILETKCSDVWCWPGIQMFGDAAMLSGGDQMFDSAVLQAIASILVMGMAQSCEVEARNRNGLLVLVSNMAMNGEPSLWVVMPWLTAAPLIHRPFNLHQPPPVIVHRSSSRRGSVPARVGMMTLIFSALLGSNLLARKCMCVSVAVLTALYLGQWLLPIPFSG